MTNYSPLASFDDSWQNAHTRRRTVVGTVDKHIDACTFVPVPNRSVDSFLNVGSVEVYTSAFRKVAKGPRKAEDIPKYRASRSHLPNELALQSRV